MNTPDQVLAKVEVLLLWAEEKIMKDAKHLMESGALNLLGADDNLGYPAIILVAAMRRTANTLAPRNEDLLALLRNLELF